MHNDSINRPIFFIGFPRSGTTILFEAFSVHQALAWPSNTADKHPDILALNLFRRVHDNTFFRLLGKKDPHGLMRLANRFLIKSDEAYGFWDTITGVEFARSALHGYSADTTSRERTRSAVRAVTRYQGRKRFAAKLTGPARIGYLHSIFPDAMFVHVVRNGMAVVESNLRVPFWKAKGGYDAPFWRDLLDDSDLQTWEDSERDPGVLAGLQWQRIILQAREEAASLPHGHYTEIKYEDFIADPHGSLKSLFTFSGLPDSEDVHSYVRNGPKLLNMNDKYKQRWSPDYISKVAESMQPVIGREHYV